MTVEELRKELERFSGDTAIELMTADGREVTIAGAAVSVEHAQADGYGSGHTNSCCRISAATTFRWRQG